MWQYIRMSATASVATMFVVGMMLFVIIPVVNLELAYLGMVAKAGYLYALYNSSLALIGLAAGNIKQLSLLSAYAEVLAPAAILFGTFTLLTMFYLIAGDLARSISTHTRNLVGGFICVAMFGLLGPTVLCCIAAQQSGDTFILLATSVGWPLQMFSSYIAWNYSR